MQDDGVGVAGAADMDAHGAEHRYQHSRQHSAQGFGGAPKPPHRVEVIVGEPRRRRWSAEDKAQITAESFAPGANISAVARRYGVSAGLLHYWRRGAREKGVGEAITFHAVRAVGTEDGRQVGEQAAIEIDLGEARVRLTGRVDGSDLTSVLRAIRASA